MLQERLRILREFWGLTQREMAGKVGVTGAAWQHYESGLNVPGGQVLGSLALHGVNLNWLMIGAGEMFRHEGQGEPDELPRIPPEEYRRLETLVNMLGLDELLPVSEMSFYGDQLGVLQALARRHPKSATLAEIEAAVKASARPLDRRTLQQILLILEQRRLIAPDSERPGAFRTLNREGELIFKDIPGHADLCLKSIRNIVREVVPRATPPKGFILNMRLSTNGTQGAKLIQDLRQWLRVRCTDALIDGAPDEVVVVVGAAHLSDKE